MSLYGYALPSKERKIPVSQQLATITDNAHATRMDFRIPQLVVTKCLSGSSAQLKDKNGKNQPPHQIPETPKNPHQFFLYREPHSGKHLGTTKSTPTDAPENKTIQSSHLANQMQPNETLIRPNTRSTLNDNAREVTELLHHLNVIFEYHGANCHRTFNILAKYKTNTHY